MTSFEPTKFERTIETLVYWTFTAISYSMVVFTLTAVVVGLS